MSAPIIQVLVGFQTTSNFGSPFQLNDAVLGLLDTGTLGGIQLTDLTSLVESVNINRGRNRQLDQFNAGTATVTFDNSTRILDPLNSDSPFYPFIVPRSPIIITANNIPIYTGLVVDWNLEYSIANQDMMYAGCSDDFTVLANQTLNTYTPPAQSSGARIENVLDRPEIGYQGARQIGAGSSSLGAYLIEENTNVLNYLQLVTTSEQGYLFVSSDGVLTFKGRTEVLNQPTNAVFSSNNTDIPFQTLVNEFGDELLYNFIITESPAGGPFEAFDTNSQALYQSQQYSLTNLLNSTVSEVEGLGQYLLGKYKDPVLRFTGLSNELSSLSEAHQNVCLSLDLTDIASITKTFVTGAPLTTTQTVIVSGVSHSIVPGSHSISYTFESTDQNQYATLDDPIFGVLDSNLLSF
jgi:hypothetical protein